MLCVIVLTSALAAGMELCRGLLKRKRLLSRICSFCTDASAGIRYERLTPVQIVMRAAQRDHAGFIENCSQRINAGASFADSWRSSLEMADCISGLRSEERQRLMRFGMEIGSLDTAGELEHLAEMHAFFTETEKQAERELRKKSEVYITCSLMAGMLALILVV